jgi:4-hydroxybenzoate polyprenyltransferase
MKTIRVFLEMVRFHHTIFALPFAYLGMTLAANWPSPNGPAHLPSLRQFLLITLAMVAARTVAFAINHYADREYDARNPRTEARPIPSGRLSPRMTLVYGGLALLLLAVAAWQLNWLTLALLPGALILLIGYSYTKRFTWTCHWILGATDGLAPAGAWVAVRATVDPPALALWLAVTMWVAGFDLILSCLDVDYDRREGLFSVPKRFGVATALRLARVSHGIAVAALIIIGVLYSFGWVYWVGIVMITGLLVYENVIVSPNDLSRVNIAFFNVNGYVATVAFFATLAAIYV